MKDDPRSDMEKISDLLKSHTVRLHVRGEQLPERGKRGLPTPWTPDMGDKECREPPAF